MKKKTEKEYQEQIDRLAESVSAAYKRGYLSGAAAERITWIDKVRPNEMMLSIYARGDKDKVDQIRVIFSKAEIENSSGNIVGHVVNDTLLNIVEKGGVIKSWLTPLPANETGVIGSNE